MKKVTRQGLTAGLKQFEVVTAAIYLLGGAAKSIDTEDAAVKCFELAPTLFSWQKYKDQINLELVRVSLSDAKKPKNGSLLSGSGREGWRLSAKGLDWIQAGGRQVVLAVKDGIKTGRSKAGSIDSVRRERERDRLLRSEAWLGWSRSGAVPAREARAVFRIDEYTSGKMLEIKVARLRAMFEDDADLSNFLMEASKNVLQEIEK
jgi:hypothetical protein